MFDLPSVRYSYRIVLYLNRDDLQAHAFVDA